MGDRFDGKDETFHIVAVASHPPPDAVVEAYFRLPSGGERTIGSLARVAGSPNVFEGYWDVPFVVDLGAHVMKVRLFSQGREIASDEVPIDIQHRDGQPTGNTCSVPNPPAGCTRTMAAETVSITWPAPNGPLGFYRAPDGKWRTVIDAIGSLGTTGSPPVKLRFSTSHSGVDPTFTDCLAPGVTAQTLTGWRVFRGQCELPEGVRPSMVTAIGAVANGAAEGSVDAVPVAPYVQDPGSMKLAIKPIDPAAMTAAYPSGARRRSNVACLTFAAVATDHLDRPVQGVGVDVEIAGPVDNVSFGSAASNSNFQQPSGSGEEAASNCAPNGTAAAKQGRLIVPEGPDIKHIESVQGTYVSGPGGVGFGEWRFNLFSTDSGFTNIVGWIDDVWAGEGEARPADNDVHEWTEASATSRAQWLEGDMKLSFAVKNDAAPVWGCHRYVVRAIAGGFPVPDLNVDVHAQGPSHKVQFCDIDYAEAANAPDAGQHTRRIPPHDHVDFHDPRTGNADCAPPAAGPAFICRHAEGETDANGELIFGLISAEPGDTLLNAWAEGESRGSFDRDARHTIASLADPSTTNWVKRNIDTEVRILNPSNYGPPNATTVNPALISRSKFRVVARVDAPFAIEGMEVLLGAGVTPTSYAKLGDMQRIGWTETYVFDWDLSNSGTSPAPEPTASGSSRPTPTPTGIQTPTIPPLPTDAPMPLRQTAQTGGVSVADGQYRLQVRVAGTNRSDSYPIVVNRRLDLPPDSVPEWVEITYPNDGALVGWGDGAVMVEGTASAGTEGVDVFFTVAGPRDGTTGTAWQLTQCGYVDLSGVGTTRQDFGIDCKLPAGTDPSLVSGIAVMTFDCVIDGCDSTPAPRPLPEPAPTSPATTPARDGPNRGAREGGDALRVFSCPSFPCLILTPSETRAHEGTCVPMEVRAADAVGKPLDLFNIDIHAWGPTDNVSFCEPEGVTSSVLRPAETDHEAGVHTDVNGPHIRHVEAETDEDGSVVFGVRSDDSSFQSMYSVNEFDDTTVQAWVDLQNDDLLSKGEKSRLAWIHWELPGRCTHVGDIFDDILSGTREDDKLCGLEGIDEIFAQEGADIILGGLGNDFILGDPGNDLIYGERDDDMISGGLGDDVGNAGRGNDIIKGWRGNDVLNGRVGDDILYGGRGDDTLNGGPGFDKCFGDLGNDTFEKCEKIRDKKPKPKSPPPEGPS